MLATPKHVTTILPTTSVLATYCWHFDAVSGSDVINLVL